MEGVRKEVVTSSECRESTGRTRVKESMAHHNNGKMEEWLKIKAGE